MKKLMLIIVFLITSISAIYCATWSPEDETTFSMVFQKKGDIKIGFSTSSDSMDKPTSVKFNVPSETDGVLNASASVYVYWTLYPQDADSETYSLSACFSASIPSGENEGMLVSANANSNPDDTDYLNYSVTVTNESGNTGTESLSIDSKYTGALSKAERTVDIFSNKNVTGLKDGHCKLELNIENVPVDKVQTHPYSGYITLTLEKV